MAKNKTISLDDRTALIAERMTNFSGWVRFQLIEFARNGHPAEEGDVNTEHYAPQSGRVWGDLNDKCNPKHRKGLCPVCYGE
jgi:hypothetical protein